ncbi:VQ motif-containing protein 29 [Momordica charantia]|uniref:VQ motif-containing protein 29 n=1 Tax=Momordica charantia TaxID=3673 RepID=A0A6J1D7B4_MOMCH|nr:VQ motif-containing protein 29 [Momordica charantia]
MEPHSSSSSPAVKPWNRAVAPLPPTPPQIYKVNPVDFRDVVQKLTAAPEFQDRRLQAMPAPRPSPPPGSAACTDFSGEGAVIYYGYPGVGFSERY